MVDPLGRDFGHLWYTLLGFKGENPIHIASNLFILSGFLLLSASWRVLYNTQREGQLATTGPYSYIRHPQYMGFIAIRFGFLSPEHPSESQPVTRGAHSIRRILQAFDNRPSLFK